MDFVAVVDQAIALLRQRGRVTYRTLQRQFQLDDDGTWRRSKTNSSRANAWRSMSGATSWSGQVTLRHLSPLPPPRPVPAPPPAASSPPEAERRQLTVLFCDLVGLDGALGAARPGRPA